MSTLTPSGLPREALVAACNDALDSVDEVLDAHAVAEGSVIVLAVLRPIGNGRMDIQLFGCGDLPGGEDADATLAFSLLTKARERAAANKCALAAIYSAALDALRCAAMPLVRPI